MYSIPFPARTEPSTLAPPTVSSSPCRCTVTLPPASMVSTRPSVSCVGSYAVTITWCSRMVRSWLALSGLSRVSTVPSGSLSKAALTGAKTVNGPGLLSGST